MNAFPPLILTLKFGPPTFTSLDQLRRTHFPPARNVVPAHVTLFHALPFHHESAIRELLAKHARETAPFPLKFSTLRSLGRGVAIEVEAPALHRLRAALAAAWEEHLIPQDRQRYRPHVTLQNKAEPVAARRLFDELQRTWQALSGTAEGLLLWRYLGGPWEPVAEFDFAGARTIPSDQRRPA